MGIDYEYCRITPGGYRVFLRVLLAGAALAGVQVVHAATWKDGGGWSPAIVAQGNDGTFSVLPDTLSPNNTHVTTCTPQLCTRTGDLPAPIGKGNPRLKPSASFPKMNIATGALALGSRLFPYLTVGKALYDWFQAANVGVEDDGDLTEVSGRTTSGSVRWSNDSALHDLPAGVMFSSPSAVCGAYLSAYKRLLDADSTIKSYDVSVSTEPGTATVYSCRVAGPFQRKNFTTGTINSVYTTTKASDRASCFDDAGRFAAFPTGGICPQGQVLPLSAAAAEQRLNAAPVTSDLLRRAFDEVLKSGGSIQDTGTHSVTGPSSVPGETKTKTTISPNGTAQVVTTTTTHNYTYNDNRVTITTTVTTQNPDGSTETETTDAPEFDQCANNPTSAACTQLGDPPSSELPEATKTVSFAPVSFSANQSCPGPVQFNALGRQLEFSYAPMCDTISTWIRALVLAGCAFIAAFVFIGGLKS